jgi:hypothetical protein
LALTEYSLTYKPLRAVKGQIVADFLVEHSISEAPIESIDIEPWNLYFDGSRHRHGTGIGIFILSPRADHRSVMVGFGSKISKLTITDEDKSAPTSDQLLMRFCRVVDKSGVG